MRSRRSGPRCARPPRRRGRRGSRSTRRRRQGTRAATAPSRATSRHRSCPAKPAPQSQPRTRPGALRQGDDHAATQGASARLTLKLNGQVTVRLFSSGWDDSYVQALEVPAIPATTYRLEGVIEVHQDPYAGWWAGHDGRQVDRRVPHTGVGGCVCSLEGTLLRGDPCREFVYAATRSLLTTGDRPPCRRNEYSKASINPRAVHSDRNVRCGCWCPRCWRSQGGGGWTCRSSAG